MKQANIEARAVKAAEDLVKVKEQRMEFARKKNEPKEVKIS